MSRAERERFELEFLHEVQMMTMGHHSLRLRHNEFRFWIITLMASLTYKNWLAETTTGAGTTSGARATTCGPSRAEQDCRTHASSSNSVFICMALRPDMAFKYDAHATRGLRVSCGIRNICGQMNQHVKTGSRRRTGDHPINYKADCLCIGSHDVE
jgi:hypothetical protein